MSDTAGGNGQGEYVRGEESERGNRGELPSIRTALNIEERGWGGRAFDFLGNNLKVGLFNNAGKIIFGGIAAAAVAVAPPIGLVATVGVIGGAAYFGGMLGTDRAVESSKTSAVNKAIAGNN